MSKEYGGAIETTLLLARKVQYDSIVVDMANSSRLTRRYAAKIRKAGVHGVIFTIAGATLGGFEVHRGKVDEGQKNIRRLSKFIREHSDLVLLGTEPENILGAKEKGKVAVFAAFQNSMPFLKDYNSFRRLVRDGLRVVQLTYNRQNEVGSGCLANPDSGLTEFGKTIVGYLNDECIVIDLSHVGDKTTLDAIKASRAPVMFTHANARRLCRHPRNKPDELLTALKANGGVVGLNAFPAFVDEKPPATLAKFLDHAEYIGKLCGTAKLGIGPDLIEGWTMNEMKPVNKAFPDWGSYLRYPSEMDTIAKLENIAAGLLQRGFSSEEVSMILGGNFLRVFRAIHS